jgi:hypothetical protein
MGRFTQKQNICELKLFASYFPEMASFLLHHLYHSKLGLTSVISGIKITNSLRFKFRNRLSAKLIYNSCHTILNGKQNLQSSVNLGTRGQVLRLLAVSRLRHSFQRGG